MGPPIELANGLKAGGPIVQDEKAIYWVEFGGELGSNGRVRKVAKP